MTGCHLRVEALCRRARAQLDALSPLSRVFAQEAEHLGRHDQAQQLDALGEKVAQEVSDMQRMETAASYGFDQAMLITGLMKFGIGSLEAVASRSHEHPLSVGARLAEGDFARTAPFGEVRVAVGVQGIPDDVNVVPLSRWAREQDRSESEVVALLKARGYRLAKPETFLKILERLKRRVLKGTLSLPVAPSSLGRHGESIYRTR